MTTTVRQAGAVRVEVGDPVAIAGAKAGEVLVAAALGARAGTKDPVDLALLSAAAREEDLRHYQQLAHEPAVPEFRRSITRVRHLDTGSEELVARGNLDDVLYLCRADQATRFRADSLAELADVHGFRAVGVARGEPRPEGGDAWRFLGFIPVKATRLKSRRHEEPAAFRYVPVWDWQLRTLHWLAFLAILTLCVTGYLMGTGRVTYAGPKEVAFYLGYLRLVHFVAGWLLIATAILRIAGLFYGGTRYQRWRALFPVSPRELKNLLQVLQNYLFCRFDQGPHYVGHNPLQQVAYTGIYLLAGVAVVTGLALYALYAPDHWFFRYFFWIDQLVGSQYVRLIHLLMLWVFLAFIPIHIYLAIRADTVERDGAISSIFSGGRWCRKGSHFEDG
jgi:Ni/Fe-hydrogenase b-type cytochrome subunit